MLPFMHCIKTVWLNQLLFSIIIFGLTLLMLCAGIKKWTKWETVWWCKRERKRKAMKGYFLAGLWPISVSFPITLTRRNTRVSQVIMNAVSEAWPFSHPPAHLVCLHCGCISLFYTPLVLQCFWLHLQQCFHFCRFNYLCVRFTAWLVVTNVQTRKCLSFALVSSKLSGQLFTFAIHGLVCMNVKGRLFYTDIFL